MLVLQSANKQASISSRNSGESSSPRLAWLDMDVLTCKVIRILRYRDTDRGSTSRRKDDLHDGVLPNKAYPQRTPPKAPLPISGTIDRGAATLCLLPRHAREDGSDGAFKADYFASFAMF